MHQWSDCKCDNDPSFTNSQSQNLTVVYWSPKTSSYTNTGTLKHFSILILFQNFPSHPKEFTQNSKTEIFFILSKFIKNLLLGVPDLQIKFKGHCVQIFGIFWKWKVYRLEIVTLTTFEVGRSIIIILLQMFDQYKVSDVSLKLQHFVYHGMNSGIFE